MLTGVSACAQLRGRSPGPTVTSSLAIVCVCVSVRDSGEGEGEEEGGRREEREICFCVHPHTGGLNAGLHGLGRHSSSPGCTFLVCEMGVITAPASRGYCAH